jgi:uncharacterized protein YndB with AHSA1/START domain
MTTQTTTPLEIHQSMVVRAPRERVWRALTEPDELAAWFPTTSAEIEPRAGADGWLDWGEQGRYAIRVEEWQAPERLVWRWAREAQTPIDDGQTTVVEWTLTDAGNGTTRLDMREYGFTDAEHHRGNTEGWTEELAELVAYLGS